MKSTAFLLVMLPLVSCRPSDSDADQTASSRLPEDSLYLNSVDGPCAAADRLTGNQIYVTNDKNQRVDSFDCAGLKLGVQWHTPSRDFLESVRFADQQVATTTRADVASLADPIGKSWGPGGQLLRYDGRNHRLSSLSSDGTTEITFLDSPAVEDFPMDSNVSGERLCHSRDPVYYIAPSIDFSLVSLPQNSSRVLMTDTCGYVDVSAYSEAGRRLWTAAIWERGNDEEFWGISSGGLLLAASDSVIALVPHRPRISSDGPRTDLALIAKVIGSDGQTRAENKEPYPGNFVPFPREGAVCGPFAFVTGRLSHAIDPQPNDTNEDDVWLGKIELSTGKLVKQTTLNLQKDDFGWGVACDETGVYVAGESGKHHVDSGSWDGGSQVLIARFDHDLNVRETMTFGGPRANRGGSLFLGRDHIVMTGTWDYIPNNHLPPEENWSKGFIAVLPKSGWRAEDLENSIVAGLGDLKAKSL